MTALVDTHVFLWALHEPGRLSARAREVLGSSGTLLLSFASVWEITIKAGGGKLDLPRPAVDFVIAQAKLNRVDLLPITLAHLRRLEPLPYHHRDPFDRLLIAQSLAEGMPIVSGDAGFRAYGVPLIW